MNNCITKIVFYNKNKSELEKIRSLFQEVSKTKSVYHFFNENKMKWPIDIDTKFQLNEVSNIVSSKDESYFNIVYHTPKCPTLSIILDLLGSIGAIKTDYVIESEGNSFLINTDKENKFLQKKYMTYIDTMRCDYDVENTVTWFYSSSMENLCETFQRIYKVLTNKSITVDSYEKLIKLVEKLKAKNAFVNIVMAKSNYKPQDDVMLSASSK